MPGYDSLQQAVLSLESHFGGGGGGGGGTDWGGLTEGEGGRDGGKGAELRGISNYASPSPSSGRPLDPADGYPYIEALLCLAKCTPMSAGTHDGTWAKVVTPLRVEAWEEGLASHPDGEFARYVCEGVREGFRGGIRMIGGC